MHGGDELVLAVGGGNGGEGAKGAEAEVALEARRHLLEREVALS